MVILTKYVLCGYSNSYNQSERKRRNQQMSIQWEYSKSTTLTHSSRWGHSSESLPNNDLVFFGGYADSKFLNDVWIYKTTENTWFQVRFDLACKKPSERSNSTFIYSELHKGIIMFAGGSRQNQKFNDLWCLNITQTDQNNILKGQWKQLFPQKGKIPWARTYHVTQKFHKFMLIHGGQTYAGQIEDLWALDLQTLSWVQLKFSGKQQARKFHSSAIIKNQLFLFGGISENYQTFNKIQSIDLTLLKSQTPQNIKDNLFQCKQVNISSLQKSLIGRWGHVSKVYDNRVYIFGGRTLIQHNDLLMFDPKNSSIQKINTQKQPKGRRKPCIWVSGSYLIINSGYNGKYLRDQFWINLRFTKQKNHLNQFIDTQISYKKEACDIHINTADNKYVDLHSKFIKNSFETEEDMIMFLEQLAQMKYEMAEKYKAILNTGVYVNKNQHKNDEQTIYSFKNLPQACCSDQINESLLKKYKITYSPNPLLSNKKKMLFNVVKQNIVMNLNPLRLIRVSSIEFQRIYNQIQRDFRCDLKIFCSKRSVSGKEQPSKFIKCCKYPLVVRSEYFKNILRSAQAAGQAQNKPGSFQTELKVEIDDLNLLKILLFYCYFGHVIVPNQFDLIQSFHLYVASKKYAFKEIMNICYQQIKQSLSSKHIQSFIQKKMSQKETSKISQKVDEGKMQQNQKSIPGQIIQQKEISECQQIINFCLKQLRPKFSNINRKFHQNLKHDKWRQLLQNIVNKFSQILMKNVIKKVKISRVQESRLLQKSMKANKNAKVLRQQNKENINLTNEVVNRRVSLKQRRQSSLQSGQNMQQPLNPKSVLSNSDIITYLINSCIILPQIQSSKFDSSTKVANSLNRNMSDFENFIRKSQNSPQIKQSLLILNSIVQKQKKQSLFKLHILISELRDEHSKC